MNTPTPEGRVGMSYRCKVCRADVTFSGHCDYTTGVNSVTGKCEAGHAFFVSWKASDPLPEQPFDSVLEIGGVPV